MIREPIEVRVEKDMIEIVSFPGPDRSVTHRRTKIDIRFLIVDIEIVVLEISLRSCI